MGIVVDGIEHQLLKVHHCEHMVKLFIGPEDFVSVPSNLWESAKSFTLYTAGRFIEVLEEGE